MQLSKLVGRGVTTALLAMSNNNNNNNNNNDNNNASPVSNTMDQSPPQHVVIVGAGIMGLTTAYYLKKQQQQQQQQQQQPFRSLRVTLVDRTGSIAPAASGKAGGFLAKDWNDGTPTQALTHRSFVLHQRLADTWGANVLQYRRLTCAAVPVNPYVVARRPAGRKLQGLEWVDGDTALGIRVLGTEDTIAQVHPAKLCEQLWQAISTNDDNDNDESSFSVSLQKGIAVGTVLDKATNEVRGVQLDDGRLLEGTAVVWTCGPWTNAPRLMAGVKYHSVVVPTRPKTLSQCVFFSGCGDPEIYVRPDATAYCTGYPEPPVVAPIPEPPGQEVVRADKIDTILTSVGDASGGVLWKSTANAAANDIDKSVDDNNNNNKWEILQQQACFLPTTQDGVPLIGRLPQHKDCYIATGHSCWGILLGPATGEALAHLISTGELRANDTSSDASVDIRQFSPARYPATWFDGLFVQDQPETAA